MLGELKPSHCCIKFSYRDDKHGVENTLGTNDLMIGPTTDFRNRFKANAMNGQLTKRYKGNNSKHGGQNSRPNRSSNETVND